MRRAALSTRKAYSRSGLPGRERSGERHATVAHTKNTNPLGVDVRLAHRDLLPPLIAVLLEQGNGQDRGVRV